MRSLLALLFTLILMVTMLQADVVLNEENEKIGMKAKRQLVSETALGRKMDAGGGTETLRKLSSNNKGSDANSSSSKQLGTDTTAADDGNDANDSYQNYGNDSEDTHSHQIFVKTDPPVHHWLPCVSCGRSFNL